MVLGSLLRALVNVDECRKIVLKKITYRFKKSKTKRIRIAFGVEALSWTTENMVCHSTCQHFEMDYKDLIAILVVL